MSVVPVRQNRLTVRAAAVLVAAACALALGACRSPETTTTAGGGSSTSGKLAPAGAPTTKAKKPPSKFAKECMSIASFQYFNHMPESGKAKKDTIADDPAAVQKKLKEIGDGIATKVPELAAPLQAVQASRPGGIKPDNAAWATANTTIADWVKANC